MVLTVSLDSLSQCRQPYHLMHVAPRKKRFSSQLEAWIDHPYEDMEIPQPVSTVRLTYVVRSPVYDSVAHEDEDRYQTPAVENPGGSRCNQPTEVFLIHLLSEV